MSTRYNARGLATAPTWNQVTDTIFPEIRKLHAGSLLRVLGVGRVLQARFEMSPSWFLVGAASDRPANLEGLHGASALRVIDEAKAIDRSVVEATEAILSANRASISGSRLRV